jgi:hypothetical protein
LIDSLTRNFLGRTTPGGSRRLFRERAA